MPLGKVAGQSLPRDNASVAAAATIREAILTGQLRPGQRLKESELAEALGISRTPIREALMLLQVDGLITTLPRRGSVVRSFEASELADMFQLRMTLEELAARRACERQTTEDIAQLEASIERLDAFDVATASITDIWRENVFFHIAVAEAAHTMKLVAFLRNVFDLPAEYHPIFPYTEENKKLFVAWHKRITGAIVARDADLAAKLVNDHLAGARGLALTMAATTLGETAATAADDA